MYKKKSVEGSKKSVEKLLQTGSSDYSFQVKPQSLRFNSHFPPAAKCTKLCHLHVYTYVYDTKKRKEGFVCLRMSQPMMFDGCFCFLKKRMKTKRVEDFSIWEEEKKVYDNIPAFYFYHYYFPICFPFPASKC